MSSKKNSQIYVARFSRSTNEDDLSENFKQFGKVKEISMKNGYAFIEYLDYRDAEEAVEKMDGKSIDGQKIVVEMAGANKRNRKSRGSDRGSGGARGPQPGDKCFNCGKTGHWANECRESRGRRNRSYSSRSDSYSSKSSSSSRDRKKKKKEKKHKKNKSRSRSRSKSSRSYSSKSKSKSRDRSEKKNKRDNDDNHKEKNNENATKEAGENDKAEKKDNE